MLGIGAAWYEREHLGLGVEFPPLAQRFERLEETVQICDQMWSDNDGPFNGAHYHLAETICSPRPIQQPRPRILIGGSGERKTLRIVANYADLCNLFAMEREVVAHKLTVLAEHCDTEGRDPGEIERSIIVGIDALTDTDGFLHEMERYAALGIDTVWTGPHGDDPHGWVTDVMEHVAPRLADWA